MNRVSPHRLHYYYYCHNICVLFTMHSREIETGTLNLTESEQLQIIHRTEY